MADVLAYAEVRLWDQTVGGVVELEDGGIVFEYDEDFRKSGLEISPIHLPLSLSGPVRFEEIRRASAFQGLPGVLADALPDSFGRKVIRAYYTARGEVERALSPVQNLLYVGTRAIGALEFHPPMEPPARTSEAEALEMADLVADARRILSGEVEVTLPEIYRIGSSAGGMRPKAVVLYNPEKDEIRSAFASPDEGDVPAIVKFDGVGPDAPSGNFGRPLPYNRIEAAYARMAQEAGVRVADLSVWEGPEGHAHLIIRRFDRPNGGKLHQHTLGGLLHLDYNHPGASSYEEYLRTILSLGMSHSAVVEGYRRMVMNVLAINQDDHVKNQSFQMDEAGAWSLTPAYDITFAKGSGWTANHQMRVGDKRAGIERADLIRVARNFGVRAPERILDRVAEVVSRWPEYARDTGVPKESLEAVGRALEERARQVG